MGCGSSRDADIAE
jgi:hypothetical protein